MGAVIAGLAFTAWNLFLDPQMVLWGLWVWDQPGRYLGIPLVNFLGWFVVATALTALIRPTDLPIVPLLLVYTAMWGMQALGQVLPWGLWPSALAGFLGRGLFALLGWIAVGR